MEFEPNSFHCFVASIIGLIGVGWNVNKVLQTGEEEWIAVKGKLVEYRAESAKAPEEGEFAFPGKEIMHYFGYYEFEDHNGEKRIHNSSHGHETKYPKLGTKKIVYYNKHRPGKTSDYFRGGLNMNYLGIVIYGILLVGATYFYASIEN